MYVLNILCNILKRNVSLSNLAFFLSLKMWLQILQLFCSRNKAFKWNVSFQWLFGLDFLL